MPELLEPELDQEQERADSSKPVGRRKDAEPAPPPERSRLGWVLMGAVLILATIGTWAYFHFRGRVSTDDAQVDGHVTAISPKISGNVQSVLVDDNQQVKAGQILVQIDPRDFQAKVDQTRAALMQAQGQLQSARVAVPWTAETTSSGSAQARARLADAEAAYERAQQSQQQAAGPDVSMAEANLRAAQARRDQAEADLNRMRPLADKAEISRQQFDAYVAGARVAESDLRAAQEKVSAAQQEAQMRQTSLAGARAQIERARAELASSNANQKQVSIRTADVGSAEGGVAAARANLAAAELQFSYTNIVAPVDGVVTRKSVEPGQIVSPGQGLMTVVPLHDVWITANFKETQLASVHPGQPAEIHVDMYGRAIRGHVDSIAGATGSRLSLLPPENATGNYVKVVQRIPVKIAVDDRDNLVLRPGMNVDVTIFTR